ncbi:MAG: hypothetical protein MUF45_09430 [Spirosomaceae bacterium]|jgi:hypothetical protein|nr:hypothetical protein [Spirosomataceae bacterium]
MKKLLIIAALFTLSLNVSNATTIGKASTNETIESKITVKEIGNLRFKLDFNNLTSKKASIEITDTKGAIYYKGYSDTDKAFVLNLANLSDGSYTITVGAGGEKLSYEFEIQSKVSRVAVSKE